MKYWPTLDVLLAPQEDDPTGGRMVRFGQRSVSRRELLRSVSEWMALLSRFNLSKGDRVIIFLPRGIEEIISLLACWMSGLVAVPVSARLRQRQVAHILTDSQASLLISSRSLAQQLEGVSWCQTGNIVLVEEHVSESEREHEWLDLESLKARLNADDIASILYTSGSTGKAKGVVLTHRNLVEGAAVVGSYLSLGRSDSVAGVLPLSFDYGLNQLVSALYTGCEYVVVDYVFPSDLVVQLKASDITVLALVPHLWTQFVEHSQSTGQTFPSLRIATSSGGHVHEKLSSGIGSVCPNSELFLMYGLTEAFRSSFLNPDLVKVKPRSVGRAIPGVELLVVREDGTECEPNEVGEIVHRGALISSGYWNSVEESTARFRERVDVASQIWSRPKEVWSGDRGFKDDDGDLYVVGRSDGVIKHKGFRVNINEVEDLILSFSEVLECVVVVRTNLNLETELIAYLRVEETFSERSLLRYLRTQAPEYYLPSFFVTLESFPETSSGKVDRVALSDREVEADQ